MNTYSDIMEFSHFFLTPEHWEQITPHMYPGSKASVLHEFLDGIELNPIECKLAHREILGIPYQYESLIDRVANINSASPLLLKLLCEKDQPSDIRLASYYLIQRGNISAMNSLWEELYGPSCWCLSKAVALRMLPDSTRESDDLAVWCSLEHRGYLNSVSTTDLYAILGFAIDRGNTTLVNFVLQYPGFDLPIELIRYAVKKHNIGVIRALKNKWDEQHVNSELVNSLSLEIRELIETPDSTLVIAYILNEWLTTHTLDFVIRENLVHHATIHHNVDVLQLFLSTDATREHTTGKMLQYLINSLSEKLMT